MTTREMTPVILIHGAWKGNGIFRNWPDYIRQYGKREVFTPNLRGYSGEGTQGVSFYDYVKDIQKIMDLVGRCDLVGFSSGGLLAQYLAANDSRVRTATFVASFPPKGIKMGGNGKKEMWKNLWRIITRQDIPFPWEHDGKDPLFPIPYKVAWQMWRGIPVGKINCPTLCVIPREDNTIPVETQEEIARKYSGRYSYSHYIDTGHQVPVEDADCDVIRQILGGIDMFE